MLQLLQALLLILLLLVLLKLLNRIDTETTGNDRGNNGGELPAKERKSCLAIRLRSCRLILLWFVASAIIINLTVTTTIVILVMITSINWNSSMENDMWFARRYSIYLQNAYIYYLDKSRLIISTLNYYEHTHF